MPKFLVSFTFRYHGEAQLRRTFHEQTDELTQADIVALEEKLKKDPTVGVPDDATVRVLSVSEVAPDRPKPAPPHAPRRGCVVMALLGAVPLLVAVLRA